ncbi:MAG: MCP four helix bundle domain-containing protein [Acidobacteriota bacterium]|nr:MCP four helix bundle domain-containing protein [Acidobacteriota bacterium]
MPRRTRMLLLAGFGGLLLLMAIAALDDIRALRSIQTRSDAVRNTFLERNRLLNQIRSGLYSSGTWMRDYVLEPDPERARSRLEGLRTTRRETEAAVREFERVLTAAELAPYREMHRELIEYWSVMEPAMSWSEDQRKAAGYGFLRDQIYPRRAAMIAVADRIGTLNEHQLNARILEVTALFAGLRSRVAFTLMLTLVLGGLLAAFSMRRVLAYERAAAVHLREIEQARQEMKELSSRLVEAQETERRRISRELHDEVGQTLSALLVTLGNMGPEVPESARQTVRGLAESSLRTVRNMALLLRPSMLDDLGLVPALEWQGREMSKRAGIAVSVDAAGAPEQLPDDYRTSIYRVVQEALHNCEQHAGASSVRVTLRAHSENLVLSVQDDGKGFSPENVRGMGLLGMQERIANLHGTFNVESEPGRGALIMVRLPLPT